MSDSGLNTNEAVMLSQAAHPRIPPRAMSSPTWFQKHDTSHRREPWAGYLGSLINRPDVSGIAFKNHGICDFIHICNTKKSDGGNNGTTAAHGDSAGLPVSARRGRNLPTDKWERLAKPRRRCAKVAAGLRALGLGGAGAGRAALSPTTPARAEFPAEPISLSELIAQAEADFAEETK